MQIQLRKRYETRSSGIQNSQRFNSELLPPRTSKREKNLRRSYDVFYSDEEIDEREQSESTVKQEDKTQKVAKVERSAEAEEMSDGSDSKFQQLVKSSKPPIRKTRKQKKKKGSLSRRSKDGRNSLETSKLSSLSISHELPHDLQSQAVQSQVVFPSKDARLMVVEVKEPEKMIDEKEVKPDPSQLPSEKDSKKIDSINEKLTALARINFIPDSKLKNPFCVLPQYRSQLQKHTKVDYRQYLKLQQSEPKSFVQQKINFQILREQEFQRSLAEVKQEQSDKLTRVSPDNLFQTCKHMTKEQQLQYLRHHFNNLLEKRQEQVLEVIKQNQLKKLNITSTIINEVVMVYGEKAQEVSISAAGKEKITQKGTFQKRINEMDEEIKIEDNIAPLILPKNYEANRNLSGKSLAKTSQTHLPTKEKVVEQSSKKKLKMQVTSKSKSQSDHSQGEKKEGKQIRTYDRNKILALINKVNRECAQEQKQSQIEEKKKEKQSYVNSSIISATSEPAKEVGSQAMKHSFEQDSAQGFTEIEIRTQQPSEKTDQQTRPERLSFDEKDNYRDNEGTSWSSFSRMGPKVKRLEILNRYHYNPFEETNGQDQCELWKKLMSEEINDIKSYYKYEDVNDYDCLFNEFDRLDKGTNVLLKVKQEDFYVKNYYDPVKKGLSDQISLQALVNRRKKKDEESEHVVEIDRYLFPHKSEEIYYSNEDEKDDEEDFDIRKQWALTQARRRAIIEQHRIEEEKTTAEKSHTSDNKANGLAQIKEEPENIEESMDKSFGYSQLQDLDVSIMKKENCSSENHDLRMKEINTSKQPDKDVFDMH